MKSIILSSAYFGPLEYFSEIIKSDKVIIENFDNYKKQTFRNRCYIYGANGKLLLNVPVSHNTNKGSRLNIKDAKIANEFDWQKLHWKSLESAYRTSPYFEFYEDDLRPLFEKKHKYLIDLNNESLEIVQEFLQESWDITKSNKFEDDLKHTIDLRNKINPKIISEFKKTEYTQVFSNKLGFIPNLSILDLIFMEGPNSVNYLESIYQ